MHSWEWSVIGLLAVLPFVFSSTRKILIDTFRHPRTDSVIMRDSAGHVRLEPQALHGEPQVYSSSPSDRL
jgi:hypothetical protein